MGCTSSANQVEQQILPLPSDIVNSYIDRIPLIIINKIKDKFESYSKQNQDQINFHQFIHLFTQIAIADTRKKTLFQYFNNNKKKSLKLSKFIEKYAILIKSNEEHFSQIIHRIYCKNIQVNLMGYQQFQIFHSECFEYFQKSIEFPDTVFPLAWRHFYQLLQDQIKWQKLQRSFNLISIDELPFKKFHEQYESFSQQEYIQGEYYYIVSSEWFSRWLLFYGYQDFDIRNSNYQTQKSTVKLRKKHSVYPKRKISKSQIMNSSKMLEQQNARDLEIIQAPTQISMETILGQYSGELKSHLFVRNDIQIMNQVMWNILTSLLKSETVIKRKAIDNENIELYPLSIYFYQTNKGGEIIADSFERHYLGRNQNISHFRKSLQITEENIFFYLKNFGKETFSKQIEQKSLQQICSQNQRIVVVSVKNQQQFLQKYSRQQMTLNNITIGDKILAYFSYQNKYVEAYVLNYEEQRKQFKVHFKGYSYNYEKSVKIQSIQIIQNNESLMSKDLLLNNMKQLIFRGIRNIGNTCFMNSILQSLVSTSILDQFFLKAKLSEKKYPLNYSLSKVFKGLKKNEEFQIFDFKKIINKILPIFGGFDQQDAQQFLNLLLDKMDQELKEKPNIIDELFGGVMQSKFTCLKCKQIKLKQQKIHTISLPVPQFQFNYFRILVFPVYSGKIQRIILRLHKNAKVNEFLSEIESKTNIDRSDFIYIQCEQSVMKRYKNELVIQANQLKKITDLGLTSSLEIYAFEKIKNTTFEQRLKQKGLIDPQQLKVGSLYDFYLANESFWSIIKIKSVKKNDLQLELLKQNGQIKWMQLQRNVDNLNKFFDLGSKVQQKTSRKVFFRKFCQQKAKMLCFDYEYILSLPKWSSYNDILIFIEQFLQKQLKSIHKSKTTIKKKSVASHEQLLEEEEEECQIDENNLKFTGLSSGFSTFVGPQSNSYLVHFIQNQRNCCIFCKQQLRQYRYSSQIQNCCEPENKQDPVIWYSQEKYFNIFIDWTDIEEYNEKYCEQIEIDFNSINNEQKMLAEKINLEECLQLWSKPENIEMQCQNCGYKQHLLQTSIKKAPLITIFHLKEFKFTEQGHFVKIDINLKWRQAINLQKYCTSDAKSVYQLYSVIEHRGTTNSGHYTCLSKRHHPFERKKVWVNFDDHRSEIINEKPEIIRNAYLLFFKRVQMPSSAIVHFQI